MGMQIEAGDGRAGGDADWRPRVIGGCLVIAGAIYATRGSWYGYLAPYGLASEDVVPGVNGETGTGHFQINATGWLAIGITTVGLVGMLWCAMAAISVRRWRAEHGAGPVPALPVTALAVAAAAATFLAVLVLAGPRSSAAAHNVVSVLGLFAAGAAFVAVPSYVSEPATSWRQVQAFAGRVDGLLGHRHPAVGRVRAPLMAWQVRVCSDGHKRRWPGKLVVDCGPRWQHTSSELVELNRQARSFGWPVYEWTYDAMTKRLTGTACVNTETH
ncbi:hypothetical protein [Mycobacteroides immunogenum]|uniref:Uncharacterized protein n=1 Tax=Mycobacteroides immunogenum TaxID=83262 RepID=A0ABR5LKI7_9MYCO|nr:hypothetical protein [Mycobacteroides immunogenum]KPG26219.1 hypothetical protein AN912_25560 [Mycobacteroides immunogenum]KPG31836.1 hypothetical protein AN914_26065 [Mycobacteroides immunogenum]KPG57306.1 hypothetical protein AN918_26590 [Mycobacteroides immunogenum]